jgi:4-oxalocrotonate tautomerase
MPLIDVHVIKNVFNADQKKEIIEKITNTMVEIEGETLRNVTWVRIRETNEGDWAIGGQQLTSDAIHSMQQG